MAWGDSNTLKFDVNEITHMRKEIQNTASDLADFKKKLLQEVEVLKNEWKTPAGQKFISEVDTDWAVQVDEYIKIINAVDELLAEAESNYSEVEVEVGIIAF